MNGGFAGGRTPNQVAEEIKRRTNRLRSALRQAESKSLDDVLLAAKAYSSGPYKSKVLAAMGHPYARRDPRPPMDPGIINKQTDRLYRSWRRRLGSWSGGDLVSQVYNVSPEARFMQGTRKMIPRPIVELVKAKCWKARMRRLEAAVSQALGG